MARNVWIVALATALIGFALGRSMAPTTIEFPAPDAAIDAEEMEHRVELALRETRAFPRAGSLIRLFEGLTRENVAGAANAVRERAAERDPVDLQLFLTAYAHLDPTAAMLEVQSWPIRSRREQGLRIVMREWAASGERLAAGNFYDSLTDPDTRAVAASPLVRGWALSGDVEGARALALRFFEDEGRREVVDALVGGVLHARGTDGALALARAGEPHGPRVFDRQVTLATLALVGREDAKQAAAYYDELLRPEPTPWLTPQLVPLAGLMRNDDPRAALEWLLPKSDGPERTRALKETMGTWARRDFDAARAWFEARGTSDPSTMGALSPTDSTLLSGLVRRQARVQPSEAAAWAVRLRPESDRLEMLRRVAYFWSMKDPAAADAWLATLVLSDAERAPIADAAEWGRSRDAAARAPADDL
ncbi:MAG: hypothetical protein R3F21_18070 [Myxococcota bacterium]